MVGLETASVINVMILSLLALTSAANSSSNSVILPSPSINGSVAATTTQTDASVQVQTTSAQINATSASPVQEPPNLSDGSSSLSRGRSSVSPSPTLSMVPSSTSSNGPSSGGQSSKNCLSESLHFDEKLKQAMSEMEMKSNVKPTGTSGEDISFCLAFQKLLKDLEKEFETQPNVRLNYSCITEGTAIQVKKYDCVKDRLCTFPQRGHTRSKGAAASSISLPLECPMIVIKDPPTRRRRDVQMSVELDYDDLPMVVEDPIEYRHLYHYVRTRREALENQNTVCIKSEGDQCFNTRLNVTLKITNRNYTSELANKESSAYKELTKNITENLEQNITAHNKDWHFKIHNIAFRAGSLVANFLIDHNSIALPGLKNYLKGFGASLGPFIIGSFIVEKVNVVHGGWSNYSAWPSTTDVTIDKCGKKFQVNRTRSCTKPRPENGGNPCTGQSIEFKPCECRRRLVNTGGTISSPYWPSEYPVNADCLWVLEAPFNYTVQLKIGEFDLETDKKCYYDYLQIFDGNSTDAPVLMTRTCGSKGENRTIASSDTFMTVQFKSDKSVTFKGFTATWRKVVKPWKSPKPIQYKEQNVTVTKVISCPMYNNSFVPLGKATTCLSKSDSACYFETPAYLISCLIGVTTNRNDLPLDTSSSLNITFKHIMHKELFPSYYMMDKTCVTWNTTLSKGNDRAWSKRGCSVERTNISHTTCRCDHTGIFAVLVSEKIVHKEFSLLANTYAGIGVSFVIIIIAILHIVWKVDVHGGEVMRINICVAIMLMMLTFLIGANVQAEKSLCGFLAFLEYFSVLAQFFWLMLHGLRIHGKIKEMFASGMNIEIVYVVFGWGLPLLLSLIAIGIQVDIKNPKAVCWTAIAGGSMWGYGAPLLIIVMLNISVLIAVIVPTEERKTKYDYRPMVYRVLKDATLLALFGITCMTAYFTVVHETFKAQYFLTVSVVLQAVAMIVFGREGRKDFVKRVKEKKVENDNCSQNTNEEVFDKFDDDSSGRSSRQSYSGDKSPEKKTNLKTGKEREKSLDA